MNNLIAKFCYYSFGVKFPFLLLYALPLLIFYDLFSRLIKNKYFRILLILIPPAVIFIRLLRNDPFFLSDDFAHLRLVSDDSYLEIAKGAFGGSGIWVGHRIILAFWLFKLFFSVFGARAEVFLFAIFVLHEISVILFYLLARKLFKNSIFCVLTAFVVGSFYMTWISNIHEVLAGTFVLASTYFIVRWLGEKKYLGFSLLFYFLAILSKEITFFLPIVFISLAIYYHFNIKHLEFKKLIKRVIPFFIIFFVYLFTYGKGFIGYSNLTSQDSYRIVFSVSPIPKNLIYYLSYNFPFVNFSFWGLLIIPILFLYDIVKKKPGISCFLIPYFIFLGPALLFENRNSYYYTYIASFFLFLGLTLVLSGVYTRLRQTIKGKSEIYIRIFNIYTLLVLVLGVFAMGKVFMDNCFLIQFPWKNLYKKTLNVLVGRIEQEGLKEGKVIKLTEEEKTPEMEFIYNADTLQVFLDREEAKTYRFSYNKDKGELTVLPR